MVTGDTITFTFLKLGIPGLLLLKTDIFTDERGLFSERYVSSIFKENGISDKFGQDSCSLSRKNVIRGMHYQLEPNAQGKLVCVLSGSIFDAAVDIRKGSATFGRWVGEELSAQNGKMLWIPRGFAHGFAVLEDNTIVLYKTTKEYSKIHERGIKWDDPSIGIDWPVKNPIVSAKDSLLPRLKDAEINFVFN